MNEICDFAAELIERRNALRYDEERFAAMADKRIMENHETNVPDVGIAVPEVGSTHRQHLAEEKTTFEGGSTRSKKRERYDLIPPEIDEVLAQRFGIGAEAHGEHNWKGGGAAFIRQCINHLRAHTVSLMKNGPFHSDDDIAAMTWNAGVLAWFRRHKPEEFLKALGMDAPK